VKSSWIRNNGAPYQDIDRGLPKFLQEKPLFSGDNVAVLEEGDEQNEYKQPKIIYYQTNTQTQ
jgi:hypothetical protein